MWGECALSSLEGNSGSSLEQYMSLNLSLAGITPFLSLLFNSPLPLDLSARSAPVLAIGSFLCGKVLPW